MDKKALLEKRAYFRMVHGVTLRAVKTLSDSDLDYRPVPGMRSPRELIYHIYAMERGIAEYIRTGKLPASNEELAIPENPGAKERLKELKSTSDLIRFAKESYEMAERVIEEMTEEEIAGPVEAPYGVFPAFQFFTFTYDEHWHHRGQLYTYLRMLGKEPPMIYDYEGNED